MTVAPPLHSEETFEHPPRANERMIALAGPAGDPTALPDDVRDRLLEEAKAHPDARGLTFNGYRYEIVADGAGVKHYHLHAWFFDPKAPLPLDPNNLNGAPVAVFGQVLTPQEIHDKMVGVHDTRWKGY